MVALEPSAPVDRRTPPDKVYQRFYEDFMAADAPEDETTANSVSLLSAMVAAVHDEVAELRTAVEGLTRISGLLSEGLQGIGGRIAELERSIEDLMAGSAIESSEPRFRRQYNPPTKDRGWSCEHTVESTLPSSDDGLARIAAEDARAYEIVEAECTRRDAAEGRTRKHFN